MLAAREAHNSEKQIGADQKPPQEKLSLAQGTRKGQAKKTENVSSVTPPSPSKYYGNTMVALSPLSAKAKGRAYISPLSS